MKKQDCEAQKHNTLTKMPFQLGPFNWKTWYRYVSREMQINCPVASIHHGGYQSLHFQSQQSKNEVRILCMDVGQTHPQAENRHRYQSGTTADSTHHRWRPRLDRLIGKR